MNKKKCVMINTLPISVKTTAKEKTNYEITKDKFYVKIRYNNKIQWILFLIRKNNI